MGINSGNILSDNFASGFKSLLVVVSTTETELKTGTQALAGRQQLFVYNDSGETIYVGPTGVTSSGSTKGIPVNPQETYLLPITDDVKVFAITDSGSAAVIVQELG